MALSVVGILVENDNGRATMGRNKTGDRGKGQVLNETLPNPSDVGLVES
jgi:hypothetical protein